MANFIGIAGGALELRQQFLSLAEKELSPFEPLPVQRAEIGPASLTWVSPKHCAPAEISKENGEHRFFLGNRAYFFKLVAVAGASICISSDTMGLFPVYYFSTSETFVFSSTPAVFKYIPGFSPELSIEGLVGILLTSFIVGGQTLLKGVRRLAAQHSLGWKPGETAKETKSCALSIGDRYFSNSFEKNLEIVDSLFSESVKKRIEGQKAAVLLSGGLDSRLLAGYVHQNTQGPVCAVTQGKPADFEVQCAKRVAKELGWPHEISTPDDAIFENHARLKVRHEHLASGFNTAFFMQLVPYLSNCSVVFTGVHGDSALGGATISRVYNEKTKTYDFEKHFAHLNHSGLTPEQVRALIPPTVLKDSLERVLGKLKAIYEAIPGEPFQQAWAFDLFYADRFQVGFIPRMLAFGAWPTLAFVDDPLLQAVASMPLEHLRDRRMETELVCRKFPKLAVLPLDRNSYQTTPVYGLKRLKEGVLGPVTAARLLKNHAVTRAAGNVAKITHKLTGKDRRFYYNTFDLNRPCWRKVRENAEPGREHILPYFKKDELEKIWPAPAANMQFVDGITQAQPMKTFIGLSLWSKEYL